MNSIASPASNDLSDLYRRRFREADRRSKAKVWQVIVDEVLQHWVRPQDAVLDLGCGYGEFLNHVKCGRRVGVDLNPDSPLFLAPDVEFHQSVVQRMPFISDRTINLVFTSNLLEHLPGKRDVEETLSEIKRVLVPGGHAVFLGPNVRYVPGEYWDFWDHNVPITDRSLCEALQVAGFQIVNCYAKFLPYTTRSALPQAPALVRAYLRMRPVWHLFGRQFLIRGRALAGPVPGSATD